jgi:hypothetical protein
MAAPALKRRSGLGSGRTRASPIGGLTRSRPKPLRWGNAKLRRLLASSWFNGCSAIHRIGTLVLRALWQRRSQKHSRAVDRACSWSRSGVAPGSRPARVPLVQGLPEDCMVRRKEDLAEIQRNSRNCVPPVSPAIERMEGTIANSLKLLVPRDGIVLAV